MLIVPSKTQQQTQPNTSVKVTVFVRVSYLLTSFVDVSFLECEPSNFPVIRNIQTHHDVV